LQCVAVCCVCCSHVMVESSSKTSSVLQCVAVCCSVLQCVAVCCSHVMVESSSKMSFENFYLRPAFDSHYSEQRQISQKFSFIVKSYKNLVARWVSRISTSDLYSVHISWHTLEKFKNQLYSYGVEELVVRWVFWEFLQALSCLWTFHPPAQISQKWALCMYI